MVKKVGLFLVLCVTILAILISLLVRNDSVCFGERYGISSLAGEFQTIFENVSVARSKMRNRVLRGKVLSYAYDKKSGILAGKLDVSVLRNKYLSDLIEPADKDGYFIVDIGTGVVVSGLEKNEYISQVKELTGSNLELNPIDYLDRLNWSCLVP
jgi:hypothetical protein